MKKNWSCPLCGNKSWIRIRKNTWNKKIFPKRKLITCAKCRCSSMDPMITSTKLEKINKVYWSKYQIIKNNLLNRPNDQALSRVKFIRKYYEISNQEKILDIGCGLGTFFDSLINEIPQITEFYAVEPDNNMREYLASKGINKVYKNIDDAQENDFSLIILSHVLEHLPNPREFLIKIMNYMQNDAILFIEVPNRDDLYKRFLGLHTVVFNVSIFHKILNEIGYKVIKITTAGPPIPELIPKLNLLSLFTQKIIKLLPKKIIHIVFRRLRNNIYKIIGKNYRIDKKITSSTMLINKYKIFYKYGVNRRYIRILVQKNV